MVGIFKSDDFFSAGGSRKFDGTFNCLALIDKIHTVESGNQSGESLCQQYLRTLHIFTVHHQVHVFFELLMDGFEHLRVTMSDITHGDTADQVEPFFAV